MNVIEHTAEQVIFQAEMNTINVSCYSQEQGPLNTDYTAGPQANTALSMLLQAGHSSPNRTIHH